MSSEETVVLEVQEEDSSTKENTSNSELEAEAKAKARGTHFDPNRAKAKRIGTMSKSKGFGKGSKCQWGTF